MFSFSAIVFGLCISCFSNSIEGTRYGPPPMKGNIIHGPPAFVHPPVYHHQPEIIPHFPMVHGPPVEIVHGPPPPPVHFGPINHGFMEYQTVKVETVQKDAGKGDDKNSDKGGDWLKSINTKGGLSVGKSGGEGKGKVIENIGEPVDGGTVVIDLERKSGADGSRFDLNKWLGIGPNRGDIAVGPAYDKYHGKYPPFPGFVDSKAVAAARAQAGLIAASAASQAAAEIALARAEAERFSANAAANLAATKAAIEASNQGIRGGVDFRVIGPIQPVPLPTEGLFGGTGGGFPGIIAIPIGKIPAPVKKPTGQVIVERGKGTDFTFGPIPDGVVPIFPEIMAGPIVQDNFPAAVPLKGTGGGIGAGTIGLADFPIGGGDLKGINTGFNVATPVFQNVGNSGHQGGGFGLIGSGFNNGLGVIQGSAINPNLVAVDFTSRFEGPKQIGNSLGGNIITNDVGAFPVIPSIQNFETFPKAALFDSSKSGVTRDRLAVKDAAPSPLVPSPSQDSQNDIPPPIVTVEQPVSVIEVDKTIDIVSDNVATTGGITADATTKTDVLGIVN